MTGPSLISSTWWSNVRLRRTSKSTHLHHGPKHPRLDFILLVTLPQASQKLVIQEFTFFSSHCQVKIGFVPLNTRYNPCRLAREWLANDLHNMVERELTDAEHFKLEIFSRFCPSTSSIILPKPDPNEHEGHGKFSSEKNRKICHQFLLSQCRSNHLSPNSFLTMYSISVLVSSLENKTSLQNCLQQSIKYL